MSRYMVNKLMWEVERSERSLAAFRQDPKGFLIQWEAIDPQPPYPEGGSLTNEERVALEALDYQALYAMGAHPFILWQFVRALWTRDQGPVQDLIESFRLKVGEVGYPDFTT